MQINEDIFGTDRCVYLNELNIHFPLDHWWSSLDNFPNAGLVVPVSTIGNAIELPTALLG